MLNFLHTQKYNFIRRGEYLLYQRLPLQAGTLMINVFSWTSTSIRRGESSRSSRDVDRVVIKKIHVEQAGGKHILAEACMADVEGYGGEGQCDTQHAGFYMFMFLQYFFKKV
jgi:hypothetical protein